MNIKTFEQIEEEAKKHYISTGNEDLDARLNLSFLLGMVKAEYENLAGQINK